MKFQQFIEDYFTIDHQETGALVPFVFRNVQKAYYNQLSADYLEQENFRGLREIILKSRKEGFTSFILALFCADIILNDNPVRYLEISYKDDATKQHFRRAKNYVMSWGKKKTGITDEKKLEKVLFESINDGSEFVLRHNKASFFVGTASTRTGERGGTTQGVLFSEAAFYPDTGILSAAEIIEATRNQVAVGTGMIFIESTANRRNHFYTIYQKAKLGQVDYKPRFFSWRDFYTPDEFEQIKAGFTDKSLIAQEFPDNDNEAFLSGGDYYFSISAMQKYERQKAKPIADPIYQHPLLKQYRKLEPREYIIIGGDCSQGGKDNNAAQFYSQTKKDVPIVYHGNGVAASMTSDLFLIAEKVFDVTGIKPMICLERNNGGASEMERLNALNRMYKYLLFKMPNVGSVTPGLPHSWGYQTSALTRPTLLGDLKTVIDTNAIGIYNSETIEELFSFIVSKNGKPEADRNAHDDLVFALGIALQVSNMTKPENDIDLDEIPDDTAKYKGLFY